jgi:hypothetical protein
VKRWIAAAALVAAVAAVAVILLVRGGPGAAAPTAPIAVQASLSPAAVHFGDTVTARAAVVVDPARVDVTSLRLVPRFLSYRVALATRGIQHDGASATVSYDLALECLDAGCAPGRPQVALQFPPALLRYRTLTGAAEQYAFAWPEITVASRLDDADRANPYASLRTAMSPPAPYYDVSPGPLDDGLIAGSALLVLAAGGLLWLAFRRRSAPRTTAAVPDADPLGEAVRLVREIAADGHRPELRRLALQRLVTELRASGRIELAESAGRLAWSGGAPTSAGAGELADRVEREVAEP